MNFAPMPPGQAPGGPAAPPPPPPNAKPGVQINPLWNYVWTITAPNHTGAPPDGYFLGFGNFSEIGPRIGTLRSVASNLPGNLPQARWDYRYVARGFIGLAVLVFGMIVFESFRQSFLETVRGGLSRGDLETYSNLTLFGVFAGAAFLAGFVVWITRYALRPQPSGPRYTCTMVGTDGWAIVDRHPAADYTMVVRYDDVTVAVERTSTTTTVRNQYGTVLRVEHNEKLTAFWESLQGQLVYRTFLSATDLTHDPRNLFHIAAERAHVEHKLNAVVAALPKNGWAFNVSQPLGRIVISTSRVDFAFGAMTFSVPPAEIQRIGVAQGKIHFTFRRNAPFNVPYPSVRDAKLMLASFLAIDVDVN